MLDDTFAAASRNKEGTPNVRMGSDFADRIAGNPKQAENLEAAVRALPGGGLKWEGFTKALRILRAQGQHLRPGSPTGANIEISSTMASGPIGGLTNPMALAGKVYDDIMRGLNSRKMVRILTDPKSAKILEELALTRSGDARATFLTVQLLGAGTGQTTGR